MHASTMRITGLAAVLLGLSACQAQPRNLEVDLQTRDAKTGQPALAKCKLDTAHTAVVIVDPWNFHWCMTACERVQAMVPRWNKALQGARQMGMRIVWAPSDAVGAYSGWPQREKSLAVPQVPVPRKGTLACRFTVPVGPCMCGPGIACVVNYGWDGMNPDLVIGDDDYITSSTEEVYAILRKHEITHVIYMGLHTNMCLFGKPGALRYMADAGLTCLLARDINDAFSTYNPANGYTPDRGTAQTDDDLERAGIPTINVGREWIKAGLWKETDIVETVRIAPWGKPQRPYLFDESVTVTLTAPHLAGAEIRYTLDERDDLSKWTVYTAPIKLTQTTRLHAVALRQGNLASIPTHAFFARRPPQPPLPDVYLDELPYVPDPYARISGVHAGFFWLPKTNQAYDGQPLRIRRSAYLHGLGFRAPGSVRYDLKGDYERFVASVGADDNIVGRNMGACQVIHVSVVFRVFLDGQLAAESPVMRATQAPWRFDVKIPPGARQIHLACLDAGSRNPLDLGDWVDAGFICKGSAGGVSTLPVPGYWENDGRYAGHDGFAWYRCYVKVPQAWKGKDLTLVNGPIDNSHEAYFNGRKVGGAGTMPPNYTSGLDSEKPMTVPADAVRPGEWNLLAIRVYDAGGAGGFRGGAGGFKDVMPSLSAGGQSISLVGRWRFDIGDNMEWSKPQPGEPPQAGRFEKK